MTFTEFIQTYPEIRMKPKAEQILEYEIYIQNVLASMED